MNMEYTYMTLDDIVKFKDKLDAVENILDRLNISCGHGYMLNIYPKVDEEENDIHYVIEWDPDKGGDESVSEEVSFYDEEYASNEALARAILSTTPVKQSIFSTINHMIDWIAKSPVRLAIARDVLVGLGGPAWTLNPNPKSIDDLVSKDSYILGARPVPLDGVRSVVAGVLWPVND